MPDSNIKNWFLGPMGENSELLQRLATMVIERAAQWRAARTKKGGIPVVPLHGPQSDAALEARVQKLLDYLEQRTVPAFSSNYQAHMGWDLMLPGIVGHMVGLLFPSNNVAFEGSPGTTVLEMLVGQDLCRMVGYPQTPDVKPWGHLVGGGTLGNIEALWAARNLKFLPLAIKEAFGDDELRRAVGGVNLGAALAIKIDGRAFKDLTSWELLNLPIDQVLALPGHVTKDWPPGHQQLFDDMVNAHGINTKGLHHFLNLLRSDGIQAPKILLSHDNHYSLEKAAALLGLGQENLEFIHVDDHGRMSMDALERRLRACQDNQVPVLAVVANLGSTELGAVDNVEHIFNLREILRSPSESSSSGLEFAVHVDGAFGAYHASLLRERFDLQWLGAAAAAVPVKAPHVEMLDTVKELGLSDYVLAQFKALPKADSIAVDPHKLGFMPYPAGAVCYRNSALRDLLKFSAPYLGAIVPQGIRQVEERTDQFVGVFGVEGSRAGSAAAAVFLTHSLLRPDKTGYGKLCGKELYASKRVFAALMNFNEQTENVKVAVAGDYKSFEAARERLLAIAGKSDYAIDEDDLQLLKQCGPDLNLLCYAFNFKTESGWNQDLVWLNVFNLFIYKMLGLQLGPRQEGPLLMVSQTIFAGREGVDFIGRMLERLSIDPAAAEAELPLAELVALRSAEWNPWLTEQDERLTNFGDALKAATSAALNLVRSQKMEDYAEAVAAMRDQKFGSVAIASGILVTLVAPQLKSVLQTGKSVPVEVVLGGLNEFLKSLAQPTLPADALAHFAEET